jgi:hypothetical protein
MKRSHTFSAESLDSSIAQFPPPTDFSPIEKWTGQDARERFGLPFLRREQIPRAG